MNSAVYTRMVTLGSALVGLCVGIEMGWALGIAAGMATWLITPIRGAG